MKKVFSLMICICLSLSFVGCGKSEKKSEPEGIDVEYYANLGKMPESQYALGDDAEAAMTELEADSQENGDSYGTMENNGYSVLILNGIHLYYKSDNSDKGFTHIISFNEAYGFEIGTVSIEIKETLEEFGFESAERDIDEKEAFFVVGGTDNCTCLEYEFKKNTVMFVFQENMLIATALYSNA